MKKTTKKCVAAMMTAAMLCASVSIQGIGNMGNVQAEEVTEEATEELTQEFVIEDGLLVRYEGESEEVVIPEEVTTIGGYAFNENTKLKKITIPGSVSTVKISAFENCINLHTVVIEEGVTYLDDRAFYGCKKLENLTVSTSVTGLGTDVFSSTKWMSDRKNENPLVVLNNFLIDGESCDGEVVVPNGVTYIANSAFSNGYLTSIVIPDGVTYIGNYAFGRCNSLENITIPESVTTIGATAFGYTPWLENERSKNPLVIVNDIVVDGEICSGAAVLPDHVTTIADSAFDDAENLTSVEMSENVKYIGESAFEGCTNLVSVASPSGVTYLGDRAFYNCSSLESFDIAEGVTSIPIHAFYGCSSLKSVTMADSVTEVLYQAFYNCESLEDITFSKNLTNFKHDAFTNTKWLENARSANPLVIVNDILVDGRSCSTWDVVIPDGVIAIAEYGFADSYKFFNLTIPASVTKIGENAFLGANTLKQIYGYAGSYAETYALENGYTFVELQVQDTSGPAASTQPGDTSGAGVLPSENPAVSTQPSELPSETPSEPVKDAAFYDVDGTEGITLSDAQEILKYALKIKVSDIEYKLEDAQKALKIALKIETL